MIDLHTHSSVSDGTESPAELMAAAAAKETGEAVSALVLAATTTADRTVIRAARRELEEAIRTLTEGLAALDQREAEQRGL